VTPRDRAVAALLDSPELLQLQQAECPAQDLESLARTVADTARGEGLDYNYDHSPTYAIRACKVTRKVWAECAKALGQRLPSERRISALLAATSRLRTLTFEVAAAASVLDQLCQATQQDPRMLGEARCRYESLVETLAQLAAEAPSLARAIQVGLELRPEPESDATPTPHRAHEVG
jgi:hypothetical protein